MSGMGFIARSLARETFFYLGQPTGAEPDGHTSVNPNLAKSQLRGSAAGASARGSGSEGRWRCALMN
jgi:hypothetical protein